MADADGDAPAGFDDRLAARQQKTQARNPTDMKSNLAPGYQHHGRLPNTPLTVSTVSFLLGTVFSLGFVTFCIGGYSGWWWSTYQLAFFFAAWSLFHWAEFAVTAGWNLEKCSVDSFLLENGAMYHIAHGTAVLEYLASLYFRPGLKTFPVVSTLGVVLVLLSQLLRSMAMIHAATNFSHQVALYKVEKHKLVTDGIYSYFRHPSYTGFFYWALGTQLVLQNPLSFTLYSILLWRFFSRRIASEEAALVQFFGKDYDRYRSRVGTKIPFVP